MELTRKQEEGLKIAVARYKAHEPYTCIAGYAGTGKSTLIKFIVAALNMYEEEVAYIAFTGKASEVLREKGCPNAQTAHRLLYYSKQMPNGKFVYKPRPHIEYSLIVVDEVSMLPIDMWELLLSHGVYVIACGDPFQLPPVDKTKENHILDNPHIFLDEVMRQAKESDIIVTSMNIREGKSIVPMRGNDTQIFRKQELVAGMYGWADEILVATNKNRFDINQFMRLDAGRSSEPERDDKVICLRNMWDICSVKDENPLINGTIGYLKDFSLVTMQYKTLTESFTAQILLSSIETTSGDTYLDVPIDYNSLLTGKKTFTPQQEYYLNKRKDNPPLPIEFNYGYAITTHRAQGSQWDNVLVIEENFPFDKEEHARWLYTACTRAAKKLTLILKK